MVCSNHADFINEIKAVLGPLQFCIKDIVAGVFSQGVVSGCCKLRICLQAKHVEAQ